MQNTKLTIIRHGETDWNKLRRWQGHVDIPLNDLGKSQAAAVARYLADEKFDVIYSSDLLRAHATALEVSSMHNLPVHQDPRIREISFGEWEGLTFDEIDARHGPGTMAALLADRLNKIPPQGESVESLFHRVSEFLEEVLSKHVDRSVLLVSHGGTIRAILSYFLTGGKIAWPHLELGNCSVSRVAFRADKRPIVRVVGDDQFLRPKFS